MEIANNIENLILIDDIFKLSFKRFLLEEHDNIKMNLNERSLCGRFAIIINESIKGTVYNNYFVDTEYNRKQDGKVKTIINNEDKILNINPDLIIHSRGMNKLQDNLLVVEMKKSNRPQSEKDSDRNRLILLTKASYDNIWSADGDTYPEHVCGYILGIYMELDIAKNTFQIEKYRLGKKIKEYSGNIRD